MVQNSRDVLDQFVARNSKFFDLPDGAEAKVKYLGAEPVTTYFNGQEKASIRYHFEKDGIKLMWDRTSRALANQMKMFEEGDILQIKRRGQKNQTKYEITKLN